MGEPNAEELRRFYEERSKPTKRGLFRIDEQGNLVEYDKKDTLIKTIVLPTYRPPTEDEIKEMEQERVDKIVLANRAFEDARRKLYQALQDQDRGHSEIVELNREVRDADIMLQTARFPLRSVEFDEIKVKDLDFNQPQEMRKYPYDIAFSTTRPFTLQQQYVRVGDIPLPPMISVAEAKAAEVVPETVILFSDQDMDTSPNGFLALGWPVAISVKNKTYPSVRHAIFSELATEFNDVERAATIEKAESSSDIHYTLDDVAGGREINQMKWNTTLSRLIDSINLAKFTQYPELAQRLIELPNSVVIGAYEPNDLQIGIGLSMDNVKAMDKLSWTGENLLGKALMKIRTDLIVQRAQMATQTVKRVKTSVQPSQVPVVIPVEQSVPVESSASLQVSMAPSVIAPVQSVRKGPRIAPKAPPQ
jgi:ribA/ribD-fused uncharacterized protein